MYRKNVASQTLYFGLINASTGAALTGATVTGKRSIDGAAQGAVTGTITEDAGGQYHLALSQADTNGNDIGYLFTATSAIPVSISVVTTAGDPTDSVRFGLTALPNAAASAVGGLPVAVDTSGRVDVLKLNGTSQTARDIGASVLLSAGTGTGQLDFTAGVVKANLVQILATALTETAGLLAGAFKTFFNVASPTLTCLNINQTGDGYARIGAAGAGLTGLGDTRIANLDATISSRTKPADTQAAVTLVTTATNLTNAPTAGDFTAAMKTSLNAATPVVTVSDKTGFSLSAGGVQAIWDALTSALTTVGSIGKLLVTNIDAAISSRNATTPPTVAAIRTEMDANSVKLVHLDADVSSRSTYAGGAVASVTAAVTVGTNNDKAGYTLTVTPPTVAQIRTEMDANSTKLANLDAAVSGIPAAVWAVSVRTLSSFGTLVSDVAAAVWGAGARTLTAFGFTVAATADPNVALIKAQTDTLPALPAANADKLLGRNLAGGSDGGRTVKDALRPSRNKVTIATGTVTVFAEDDTTPAWTGVVATDGTALPIVTVDPA